MPVRREIVAYHQAAHAVVAYVLGVEFFSVAMFPTDNVNGAGALTSATSYHFVADTPARVTGLEIDDKIAGPTAMCDTPVFKAFCQKGGF